MAQYDPIPGDSSATTSATSYTTTSAGFPPLGEVNTAIQDAGTGSGGSTVLVAVSTGGRPGVSVSGLSSTPEPGTALLLGAGMIALAGWKRRRHA